tara:strand:+ start:30132 stop:31358 length:1227 start_codon:yes stop_codon:yes gene_type:complete
MRRTAIVGALGLAMATIVAAPAHAEGEAGLDCGGGLVGSVLQAVKGVRSGQASLDDLLPAFDGAATRCPGNAYALHYATVAHLTKAQNLSAAQASADAIMSEIDKAFGFSQAFWALEDRDRKYTVAQGDVPVDMSLSYNEQSDLRESVISALLDMQLRAGKTHPYLSSDTAPESCGDVALQDVSAAASWFNQNRRYGHVVLPFAERVASACPNAEAATSTPRLVRRSLANLQLSRASDIVEEDPETARDLVNKVKAYRDSVLGPGETSNTSWSNHSVIILEEVEAKLPQPIVVPTETTDPLVSGGPVPAEDWFSGIADEAQVMESMGRTFDAYVSARGSPGFYSVLGKMFGATVHAPDRKAACNLIYRAASAYQQGKWRSAETADEAFPASTIAWLENWEPAPATDSQ